MADIRSRNAYKPLPLTGSITLHCFACGVERMLSPLEQKAILASLKKPCDYHTIECACGETQFILRERFIIVKKEEI